MYVYYMVNFEGCRPPILPRTNDIDWGFIITHKKGTLMNAEYYKQGLGRPSECCWMVPGTVMS